MNRHYTHSIKFFAAAILLGTGLVNTPGAKANPPATGATTRAQAIAMVRVILNRNRATCRINRIQSISAVRSGAVWKVTAGIVMSASGRPVYERVVWNVGIADGKTVAASQLAFEIESGCP